MQIDTVIQTTVITNQKLGFWQRAMLRRAHPTSIFIRSAAALWIFPLIWWHEWQIALIVTIAASAAASAATLRMNYAAVATSWLGRVALLHLHPINLALQSIGAVALIYGLWAHEAPTILAGGSLIFLGHCWGWAEVDERLEL